MADSSDGGESEQGRRRRPRREPAEHPPLAATDACGLAWYLHLRLRPPRIELGEDGLVVRYVRTHRIPYSEITAVTGDIPSRVEWSNRLFVDRRGDKRVALPPVRATLREVHDLITARLPGGAEPEYLPRPQ